MADTLPTINNIGSDWVDVYSFSGVEVGVPLTIQNVGSHILILNISSTIPDPFANGTHLYPLHSTTLSQGESGLWCRTESIERPSRLQVDVFGGLGNTFVPSPSSYDSLHMQTEIFVNAPSEQKFVEIKNNTNSVIILEQITDIEAFASLGEGASLLSLLFYFNPDFNGVTKTQTTSRAYINSTAGDFVNITTAGIEFFELEDFNTTINNEVLRVSGGQVAYYATNQSLTSSSLNDIVPFPRPFFLPPAGSIVASIFNRPIVGSGVETTTTLLLTGRFVSAVGTPMILPDNLIDNLGNNLIDDLGNNLTN